MAPVAPDLPRSRPLATLVVMTYNQRNIAGNTIQSCLDQSYAPLEIIISDDASTDGTWDVIETIAKNYNGPHTLITNRNEENLGLAAHMNKIMTLSSGILIVACAGDDICLPTRVERLLETWLKAPDSTKAISSSYISMSLEGHDESVVSASMRRRWTAEPTASDIINGNTWCVGATMAWHRDVFDYFGPIPADAPHEDTFILLRAALLGNVVYLDEPLVRKRKGGIRNPIGNCKINPSSYKARLISNKAVFKSFLIDIEKSPSNRKTLEKNCMKHLEIINMQIILAETPNHARYYQIPVILKRALVNGSATYMTSGLKIVFLNTYLRLRNFNFRIRPK
jgi:glycosyltransferase involved in cell wall biosynthesis